MLLTDFANVIAWCCKDVGYSNECIENFKDMRFKFLLLLEFCHIASSIIIDKQYIKNKVVFFSKSIP